MKLINYLNDTKLRFMGTDIRMLKFFLHGQYDQLGGRKSETN